MINQVKDAYIWSAVYGDYTDIFENIENSFADVDQTCVKTLFLLPLQGNRHQHRIDLPQGATPVFFRRRSIEINPLQGATGERPTVHCIGWKRGDEAVYLFAFEDGSTLLTTDLQAV
jgi:hypothetical protein